MKLILLTLACIASAFSDFKVSIYDNDSLLSNRGATVITAGLPFKKGELTTTGGISMVDKLGQGLPAQFTPLVRYEDGSIQWALADFQASLIKSDTARFTVKNQASSTAPASPLSVDSSNASAYYINTGVIRFRVRRSNFNLIDSLWQGNKLLVAGAGGGINVNDGTLRWGTTVTSAAFEYLGPVRATLLVQGSFFTAASGGLTYKVRIHAYAGSGELKIETSVRNCSNAATGAHATLSNGEILLPLASGFPAVRAAVRDTLVQHWQTAYSYYEDGANGLMAAARFNGGFSADLAYNKLTLAGGLLSINIVRFASQLPDLATVDKVVYLKFYAGTLSASNAAAQVSFWRYPAIAVADIARMSETGGTSEGKFGDFRDEQAVQTLHGASVTTPTMVNTGWGLYQANAVPNPPDGKNSPENWLDWDCPVIKNTYSAGGNSYIPGVHADMETDPLEGNLLTWIRTLNSNFYMRVFAYAGYFKTFYALRTDGFEYTGQYSINGTLSSASTRSPKTYGLSGVLADGRADEIPQSGSYACHVFGTGLGDYFVMTGDMEAKDALVDLAEIGWVNDNRGNNLGGGGPRGILRRWDLVARAYELTRDPKWLTRLQSYETKIFNLNFDPRGFFWDGGASPGDDFLNKRLFADSYTKPYLAGDFTTVTSLGLGWVTNSLFTQNQQGSTLATWRPSGLPLWQYADMEGVAFHSYSITGNESMRDLAIGLSQMMVKFGHNPICNRNFYEIMVDFPFPDSLRCGDFVTQDVRVHQFLCDSLKFMSNAKVCDSVVNTCNVQAHHSGYQDFLWVNAMTDAYEMTGEKKFLDAAWLAWSNGTRTPWNFTKFICPTTLVAGYSYCPGYDWNLASSVVRLFYTDIHRKADNTPPSAVNDLTVTKTGTAGQWRLSWTTPPDAGVGGEIQIKYDTLPILEFDNFKLTEQFRYPHARDEGEALVYSSFPYKANTWWLSKNVAGEPAPAAGGYQGFTLTVNKPTVYFALRVRDADGNWSLMSNSIKGDPTTAVEAGVPYTGALTLAARPNPLNGSTRIAFNVPLAGVNRGRVALKAYDIAGRQVAAILSADLKPGAHQVAWKADQLPAGVYFLKLTAGSKSRLLKVTLLR